jgi:hypothetical protein
MTVNARYKWDMTSSGIFRSRLVSFSLASKKLAFGKINVAREYQSTCDQVAGGSAISFSIRSRVQRISDIEK